jgi:DNA repair exonuclease SbcCD ATPase subunit
MTKINPKARTMSSVRKWGKYYLEQADIIAKETDVEPLKKLNDELWDFMHDVKHRRMPDSRLSSGTRRELEELYAQLLQLLQGLVNRITELRQNQEIVRRLEEVALPEAEMGIETRDFSAWNMWPLHHSKRLWSKLARASVPQ